MSGLIGTETPVDDLLEQYFPGRPRSMLYQAFESEQAALMAALLMEMRGDEVDQEATTQESVYYAEPNLAVDTVEEQTVEWKFNADSVVVYGFDAPIAVAFKAPNKTARLIRLTAEQEPFTLSPPGGLNASQMWYRKLNEDDPDTSLNIIANK
jgi:hypothetical protein